MTETRISDRDLQQLEEGARKALRRSEELIRQTQQLVKHSQQLMYDFHLRHPSRAEARKPSDS